MSVTRVQKSNKKKIIVISVSAAVLLIIVFGIIFKDVRNGVITTLKTSASDTMHMLGFGEEEVREDVPVESGVALVEEEAVPEVVEEVVPEVEAEPRAKDNLFIHIPNTAGDFIVLKEGKHAVVINAGYSMDNSYIKQYLRKIGVSSVRYTVITNSLDSSSEGTNNLLSYLKSDYILLSSDVLASKNSSSIERKLKSNKTFSTEINPRSVYKLGKSTFEFVRINAEGSVALVVSNGKTRIVLTGGATSVDAKAIASFPDTIDLYSVVHATSSFAPPNNILSELQPDSVVVNDRKQINPSVSVKRVKDSRAKLYQSTSTGNIVIGSNGVDLLVNTEKSRNKNK